MPRRKNKKKKTTSLPKPKVSYALDEQKPSISDVAEGAAAQPEPNPQAVESGEPSAQNSDSNAQAVPSQPGDNKPDPGNNFMQIYNLCLVILSHYILTFSLKFYIFGII